MKSGQTLVVLLVFMMVAIIITTASVFTTMSTSQTIGQQINSWDAYDIAEAGVEDALMFIVRDPAYVTTDRTLTVGNGIATITVSNTGSGSTITSQGSLGNFRRTLQVVAASSSGVISIQSWQEIYP